VQPVAPLFSGIVETLHCIEHTTGWCFDHTPTTSLWLLLDLLRAVHLTAVNRPGTTKQSQWTTEKSQYFAHALMRQSV
jgi:hypothetical protein